MKKRKDTPESLQDKVYTSFEEVAEFVFEHMTPREGVSKRPVGHIKRDFEMVTKGDINKVNWPLLASYLSTSSGENYEWIYDNGDRNYGWIPYWIERKMKHEWIQEKFESLEEAIKYIYGLILRQGLSERKLDDIERDFNQMTGGVFKKIHYQMIRRYLIGIDMGILPETISFYSEFSNHQTQLKIK